MSQELAELARLIQERNVIASQITGIIDRPAQIGHIGEFIASKVFDIRLEESAVAKGIDGVFRSGPLAGSTVNVKFYGKLEGLLDIRRDAVPDYYLVLTGPRATALTSRGEARLWHIDSVFLFQGARLLAHLEDRGVKIGVATSVTKPQWEAAQVFPSAGNSELELSDEQTEWLRLFSSNSQSQRI